MSVSMLFYRSHPLSRLLLGVAVVALLASGDRSVLLMVSVALVALIDGGWRNIRRALAVLRWLIIPILLLHLLMTGGERLWPESGLPLSLDGLRIGAHLSLNLLTYYSVAMLVSRLWRQDELLAYAPRVPYIGRYLFPYLLALPAVRGAVQGSLLRFKQQFDLRLAWRQAGILLTSLLRHMLMVSAKCSQGIWLRWHHAAQTLTTVDHSPWHELPVVILAIGLLGVVWLN